MESKVKTLSLPGTHPVPVTLMSLKVEAGQRVRSGTVLATYTLQSTPEGEGAGDGEEGGGVTTHQFKSSLVGKVSSILHSEGDILKPK